jgi:hypothetical protein
MKKKNNLNNILEQIVNQYFGDFSLKETEEKNIITPKMPIKEIKEETKEENVDTSKKTEDQEILLESLREDFFAMLNTTKKIEEKKELSNELEEMAKTFF